MLLSEFISFKRNELKLSQAELADRLLISTAYINDIEHGRRFPSSDNFIVKLSQVFNVSTDYFYYLTGRIPPDIREMNLTPNNVSFLYSQFRQKEINN